MTIIHNEMTYYVSETNGQYDVEDAGGSRPVGLRDQGPWDSEAEAVAAIQSMSSGQSAE